MDNHALEALLRAVASGETGVPEAAGRLRTLGIEDIGFARLDHHRAVRTGMPEIVYSPGKTPDQIAHIMERLAEKGLAVATRAQPEIYEKVQVEVPHAEYDSMARIIWAGEKPQPHDGAPVVVASGGTADLPVSEEAALMSELLGVRVERVYDVGVAGIHRLFAHVEAIQNAGVVIVVAGMEGALPSVIGGLTRAPVIAVPTSTGYGASFGGLAALLSMLNSCSPGVAVVNIDNGFGAAVMAQRILLHP